MILRIKGFWLGFSANKRVRSIANERLRFWKVWRTGILPLLKTDSFWLNFMRRLMIGREPARNIVTWTLRTRNLRDMDTLNRRPLYLAFFTDGLLRHRKPDDQEDLAEAQELVEQIKQLQPGAFGTLAVQVQIYRARNEVDRQRN